MSVQDVRSKAPGLSAGSRTDARNQNHYNVSMGKPASYRAEGEVAGVVQIFLDAAFGPEDVRALCEAYDLATKSLHETGGPSLVNEVIATKIIRIAEAGEHDPRRLADKALQAIGFSGLD